LADCATHMPVRSQAAMMRMLTVLPMATSKDRPPRRKDGWSVPRPTWPFQTSRSIHLSYGRAHVDFTKGAACLLRHGPCWRAPQWNSKRLFRTMPGPRPPRSNPKPRLTLSLGAAPNRLPRIAGALRAALAGTRQCEARGPNVVGMRQPVEGSYFFTHVYQKHYGNERVDRRHNQAPGAPSVHADVHAKSESTP